MNPEDKPGSLIASDTEHAVKSAEWSAHEHVSEQVQVEAQKLVNLVGSSELAKNAIDIAEQRQSASPSNESTEGAPTTVKRPDPFLQALQDFETSLATPVISGELITWATNALRVCEHLGELMREDVQRKHAALYASIAREDPELSSRIEKLRATDEQLLLVDYGNVLMSLKQVLDHAQSAEQDEMKVSRHRVDMVQRSLLFVISARTQETAIVTWFGEAFTRDRGYGD